MAYKYVRAVGSAADELEDLEALREIVFNKIVKNKTIEPFREINGYGTDTHEVVSAKLSKWVQIKSEIYLKFMRNHFGENGVTLNSLNALENQGGLNSGILEIFDYLKYNGRTKELENFISRIQGLHSFCPLKEAYNKPTVQKEVLSALEKGMGYSDLVELCYYNGSTERKRALSLSNDESLNKLKLFNQLVPSQMSAQEAYGYIKKFNDEQIELALAGVECEKLKRDGDILSGVKKSCFSKIRDKFGSAGFISLCSDSGVSYQKEMWDIFERYSIDSASKVGTVEEYFENIIDLVAVDIKGCYKDDPYNIISYLVRWRNPTSVS